jgi:hypothetical protein
MLFEMARALRSLTSPLTSALHQARRMARPHLHFEDGGTVSTNVRPDDRKDEHDFLLPFDVSEADVVSAIQDRLCAQRYSALKRRNGAIPSLKTTADARLFVPADVVLLLGDGAADRGKRVLEKIVKEVRHHRMLSRLPIRPLFPNR